MQIDCLISGKKQDLASTCRLLLSDDEEINRDLSNLTLVAPETQARLEALLEVAGMLFAIFSSHCSLIYNFFY